MRPSLFHQRQPYGDTVVAVGDRIGRRGYQRRVYLVVEVSPHGDALAQHIVGRELNHRAAGAAGGLGKVLLDTADKSLVLPEGEIGIDSQVVADTRLRAP